MIGDDRLAKLEELEAVVITGRFGRVRGSFLAWVAVGASIRSTNQVVSSVMCRQVSSAAATPANAPMTIVTIFRRRRSARPPPPYDEFATWRRRWQLVIDDKVRARR